MYRFWVFVHIVGVFGLLLAHGVSAGAGLRLRRERELERVRALLELSSASLGVFYVSILLLLVGGIAAAFAGSLWGEGWIWTAVVLLLLLMGAMYAVASPYFNKVREAVGVQTYQQRKKGIEPGAPRPPAEIDALLASPVPLAVAAIGVVGLLVILWLMVFKPF